MGWSCTGSEFSSPRRALWKTARHMGLLSICSLCRPVLAIQQERRRAERDKSAAYMVSRDESHRSVCCLLWAVSAMEAVHILLASRLRIFTVKIGSKGRLSLLNAVPPPALLLLKAVPPPPLLLLKLMPPPAAAMPSSAYTDMP